MINYNLFFKYTKSFNHTQGTIYTEIQSLFAHRHIDLYSQPSNDVCVEYPIMSMSLFYLSYFIYPVLKILNVHGYLKRHHKLIIRFVRLSNFFSWNMLG